MELIRSTLISGFQGSLRPIKGSSISIEGIFWYWELGDTLEVGNSLWRC